MATMYALVYEGMVLQVESATFPVNSAYQWVQFDNSVINVQPGWTYANGVFTAPSDPGNPPQLPNRIFSTPTFNGSTTAAQLSTTRDAQVTYTYNATVAITILAGQSVTAILKYADNVAMTTNPVTVCTSITQNSGVLGLTQVNSLTVAGMIPAGKYRQVTFAVTGSAATPNSLASGQEVLVS